MTEAACQSASTPWRIEDYTYSEEYRAGLYPNVKITRVCNFSGQVTRGQTYKHKITKDLVFCLIPTNGWMDNDGWEIVISDLMQDANEKFL